MCVWGGGRDVGLGRTQPWRSQRCLLAPQGDSWYQWSPLKGFLFQVAPAQCKGTAAKCHSGNVKCIRTGSDVGVLDTAPLPTEFQYLS